MCIKKVGSGELAPSFSRRCRHGASQSLFTKGDGNVLRMSLKLNSGSLDRTPCWEIRQSRELQRSARCIWECARFIFNRESYSVAYTEWNKLEQVCIQECNIAGFNRFTCAWMITGSGFLAVRVGLQKEVGLQRTEEKSTTCGCSSVSLCRRYMPLCKPWRDEPQA